ncbi:MAG: LysR family transcriptional regulator [Ignavibacteria bacterium]|nr:LysR family transcriptional regulator [Ignavibacteria bacterium]
MNIQQLEYLVAVDRLKNFTKAAEYCNVTQATLSTMVKKLEDELECVLFDRKSNPILTTETGQAIIDECRIILAHCRQIKEKAKKHNGAIEGTIKIGIIPTIAGSLLPKIIKSLLETYPKLLVEIVEIPTQSIIKQLKEGTIDAGIIATPGTDETIEETILYYEALMVYGEVDKTMKYIMPEEIKNSKVWLLEEGHCLREQFIQLCALKKKDSKPHNLTFDANSFETLLGMVDEFGGLTLIPELYYQSLPKEKQDKVSFFHAPIPVREVSLVYYRPFAKERIIGALADFITGNIAETLLSKRYSNAELVIARV